MSIMKQHFYFFLLSVGIRKYIFSRQGVGVWESRVFAPRSHHLEKGGCFRGKDPGSRVHLWLVHHGEVTHWVVQSQATAEEDGVDKMSITRLPGRERIHPGLLKENVRIQELICMQSSVQPPVWNQFAVIRLLKFFKKLSRGERGNCRLLYLTLVLGKLMGAIKVRELVDRQ